MLTVVTLNHPSGTVVVTCDALGRDAVVPSNVLLAGCRNVSADGLASVRVWSVPAAWVVTYATGHAADPVLAPTESDGIAHG